MSRQGHRGRDALAIALLAAVQGVAAQEETEPATVPVDPATEAPATPAEPTRRAGPVSIQEIVVTAQRREESASDIPLAITAYSGEDLETLGVNDTRDLGKVVPGFVASDSGYSVPVYTLRGIGFNDISYSSTGTVGVYADEASMPYAVMTRGTNLDLQRVEVLKGPQGTLYGRNSTGGTVNYIANKPSDAFEAAVTTSISRFQTLEGEGFVTGPLGETLRGRIAVHATHSAKGWQTSQTRPDDRLGELDKQSARAMLDWLPSDSTKFELTLSGWRDESEPQAPYAVAFFAQNPFTGAVLNDPQVAGYPFEPDNDDPRNADWVPEKDWQLHDWFWSPALRAEWSITPDLEFTGLLNYGQLKSDKSAVPQSGLAVYQSEQEITADIQTLGAEARLDGRLGEDVRWLAGVSAAFDETSEFHKVFIEHNTFNFPIPGIGNPTGLPFADDKVAQIGDTEANSVGVFANAEWQFTETLKFTQGVRYTKEKRDYEGCTLIAEDSVGAIGLSNILSAAGLVEINGGNFVEVLQSILSGETQPIATRGECFTLDENGRPGLFKGTLEEDNVATRTVLDWTPVEGQMFYASYTRGYKSGGFPVILAARQENFEPVTQEKLVSYEIGAKNLLFDGLLRLDTGAFYYDYRDKQLLTFRLDQFFGALPVILNAPKSHVYGVETSISASPLEGLYVGLNASYIKTRVDEYVGTTARGEENFDYEGQPFNFAPEFQTTLLAAYTAPLGDRLNLTPGFDVTYASKTNGTLEEDPNYEMPSYTMIGARLMLESSDRSWAVTVFGRNLTDELQRVGVFRTGDTIAATTAFPRTYGVTVDFRWE
ncbi:MAG TPA: TonB-dependent receptor [Nevskiaceae bacterium]|nr:TonB-dependent receptor [Nevskiaceae bacterium]